MGKKLTHEEFVQRVREKNEHVRNGDIEILGKFTRSSDRIECYCKKHDVLWSPIAVSLYKGIGCRKCKGEVVIATKTKSNSKFQDELKTLRKNGRDVYTDDIYINNRTKLSFYCSKGHRWLSTPGDILSGYGCPYCSGHKAIVGETSLWDTRPDIAALLEDPQDGYRYSAGSDKKVGFVCQTCKSVNKKIIGNVCRSGFCCQNCSDKVSYPQKFIRALLDQLPVVNAQYEYSPNWLKPYRFDSYFEHLGKCYAVEMDGHLGHGNKQFGTGEKDVKGYQRDVVKDFLATKHDIKVIRIDCQYDMSKRFEYVINNILNSELTSILDLSDVDWVECDRRCQERLVSKVAQLYNEGMSLQEIHDVVGCGKRTIGRWLQQAKNIGLCNYDVQEAKRRGRQYTNSLTIQN